MTRNARRPRVAGFTRLGDEIRIILEELSREGFFEGLRAEAEANARRYGPLAGPVRRRARPWSHALDAIESERQESTS